VWVIVKCIVGYVYMVEIDGWYILVFDEFELVGGIDIGLSLIRVVVGAFVVCIVIMCEMYVECKGWDFGVVEVDVDFEYGCSFIIQ